VSASVFLGSNFIQGIGKNGSILGKVGELRIAAKNRSVFEGIDAFEARANLLERERLAQSEVRVFREAIVGVVASLQCRATFESEDGFQIRLGYLLELFGLATEAELQSLRNTLTATYAPLDSSLPREGSHFAKWRLQLNVPAEELLAARST
jgi:hypothetical protein